MPIEQDWVKRLVATLAEAIGAALGLKKKGEERQAADVLAKGVEKALGMNARLALGLPLDDFLRLACRGEEPKAQVLAALADAFEQWAGLLDGSGQPQWAAAARARARELAARAGAS